MADRRIPRKRVPPNRLVEENDDDTAGASATAPTAPTQQVSLQKMKEENALLKAKIKFLEDKCKDIECERDFLRSSLTNALSAKEDMMGATCKSKLDDAVSQSSSTEDDLHTERGKKAKRRGKALRKKKHCKVDSSSSCVSSTSSSSQSSSSPAPRKSSKNKDKTKKRNANKKQKFTRVFLPEQAIKRYNKVLGYLKGGTTKTQAFFKCGVDRKTIADTAAIAELEACDIEAYKNLRGTFQRGQKLSNFAERCRELCRQEPLQSTIENKKKVGLLIDFCERQK
ncbi:coiled-coil domain-containing protein 106-like [Rhinichthys klamathensis goyatoka]|uniref:coiled-coil domain-containing protein 106-like n=1 Tax=Rhinichthys klamathensis goyatoka TaxID=3034132 RepID=UPI0024B4C149|nr:coiled-coil domain-containing protein 106-like [Rhinichthys klamathensis goyatoka]